MPDEPTNPDVPDTLPEDIEQPETPAVDPQLIQDFDTMCEAFGDGTVNVHRAAREALASGRSVVVFSTALAKAYQRMLRLCEWSGQNAEHGPFCPVCGSYHTPPFGQERAPNRGHLEECPLRRNLDNLNRALGITNRGGGQGPTRPMQWAGRQPTDGHPQEGIRELPQTNQNSDFPTSPDQDDDTPAAS